VIAVRSSLDLRRALHETVLQQPHEVPEGPVGFDHHLVKPIAIDALMPLIAR